MILDKEIEANIVNNNISYYKNLGYDCVSGQKIFIKTEHLLKSSSIKINVKCDVCGNEKLLIYNKYIQNTKNLSESYCCSNICSLDKRRKTNTIRFGGNSPMYSEEVKKKLKETNLKKYGFEYPSQNESVKIRSKETCLRNWGVEYSLQNEDIKKKIKNTNLKLYGVEFPTQNKNIKEKSKNTCLKKYGTEFFFKSEELIKKSKQTKLEKYENENYNNRIKAKKTNIKKFGFEFAIQNENILIKRGITNINRFGGKSPTCSVKVFNKSKETCLKNYGCEYNMQVPEIFSKAQKSSFKIIQYKNTDLTYQAGYEKYFLEQMEENGFLKELSMGKHYNYMFEEKQHKYYSDYLFRETTIEIKSSWTYNKNGKDIKKGLQNEEKWKSTINSGDNLVVLMSKAEIKNYIKNLTPFLNSTTI